MYEKPLLIARECPTAESTPPMSVLKPPLTPSRSVTATPALASPHPLPLEKADCIATSVSDRPAPRYTHTRDEGENPSPPLAE